MTRNMPLVMISPRESCPAKPAPQDRAKAPLIVAASIPPCDASLSRSCCHLSRMNFTLLMPSEIFLPKESAAAVMATMRARMCRGVDAGVMARRFHSQRVSKVAGSLELLL